MSINLVGQEFIVSPGGIEPAITSLPDGRFMVTWTTWDDVSFSYDIHGRVYDANGNALGDEFLINVTTIDQQYEPAITGLPDGRFVVTWRLDDGAGAAS